ncbi:MAG: FtsQ-type POTRA domain-containing protein [Deltaproteobacteria bacterium]|nr:FtsQ-type POTRA domain-containing protein [Deltaproteobacteria bacterium]
MAKFKLARRNVKTQARRKRLKQLVRMGLFFAFSFALLIGLRYLSLHLERLKLDTILVAGELKNLDSKQIVQLSGVKLGDPLFSLDLPEIVRKIKENPWVASVKVTRKFPHNLMISVQEKIPQLVLSVGKFYWVSSEGEIVQSVHGQEGEADLPVLTGFTRQEMEQDPPRSREILKRALKLAQAYQSQSFTQSLGLSEIHYERAEGFSLYPEKQPFRAIVGFEDFEVKLSRLSNALEKLKTLGRSFAAIDLNYEGKAILTL